MRLLLVEDDKKTSTFIVKGLRRAGFAVDHAANGEDGLHLGPESGTQSTSPKRRYVSTGIAVALAVTSHQDSDAEDGVTDTSGNASQGAAGGAVAFKLVGIIVGTLVRSRSLALGMGVYGAGRSAYSNFLGRGRDVVFPKGTAMEVGFWLTQSCEDSAQAD